jgi:flagellin
MPQIINTNLMSLNAQRNLNASQGAMAVAVQRLSSGLRINSAKDDAAGLAISERFSTQIRALNQAARNANDAISLAQTAEGAMSEISNNLQRIRELAVQASNASNSATDRAALQKEVAQLQAEIQRVATQTEFNGTKLLDGTFAGQTFQVGANAGQLINVGSIANSKTSVLGDGLFVNDVTGNGVSVGAISGLTINGQTIENVTITAVDAANAQKLADAINKKVDLTGVFAVVNGSNGVDLKALFADTNTVIGGNVNNSGLSIGTTSTGTNLQVEDIDISTFVGAQRAISIADKALNTVNSARADLGAIQNRFSSVVSNLSTAAENMSASRSRIMDADYAAETAALTRAQILQQAGVAMLAQANAMPQNVLSLLRG